MTSNPLDKIITSNINNNVYTSGYPVVSRNSSVSSRIDMLTSPSYTWQNVPVNTTYLTRTDKIGQYQSERTPTKSWIEITSLNEDLNLVSPLMVGIHFSEEKVFIAECPTFNLFTFADTCEEALNDLKELLVEDFQVYLNDYPDGLTESSVNLLRLYMAFVGQNLPKQI